MTQPQDKMRAEFEAWAKDRGYQRDELDRSTISLLSPDYFNPHTEESWQAWQAACAQQSAQPQQDARNAARYRFALIKSPAWTYAVCKWDGNDWLPINDGEGQAELDAAIATQGASNV